MFWCDASKKARKVIRKCENEVTGGSSILARIQL